MSFLYKFKNKYFTWTVFQRLFLFYCVSSTISFGLLVLATIFRLRTGSSIGIMLPVSASVVLLGLICSIGLWKLSLSRNKKDINLIFFELIQKPRLLIPLLIFLIDVIIIEFGFVIFINMQLFSKAYIGILPGFFLGLSFTLITLGFLAKNSVICKTKLKKIKNLTYQEYALLSIIVVGSIFAGNQLLTLLKQRGVFVNESLINQMIALLILLGFTNFCVLILQKVRVNNQIFDKFLSSSLETISPQITKRPNLPIISFLITGLFMGLFLIFFPVICGTNDDLIMIQLLSGYIGGNPSVFPIYSNVLLGFLYRQLFSLNSSVNWVLLFYLFVNFFSLWGLIYIVLELKKQFMTRIISILVVLAFEIFFLTAFTYTTMAAFASISGFCLLFSAFFSQTKASKGLRIAGMSLILVGSLIRFETIVFFVVMIIPFVLFNLKDFFHRKIIFTLAITGGVILITFLFNKMYIQEHPVWDSYYRYNNIHQELRDTPRSQNLEQNPSYLQSVGWSQNDFSLFLNWIKLDSETYSEEKMESLVKQIPNWNWSLEESWKLIINQFSNYPLADFLYLALASVILVFWGYRDLRAFLISVFMIILLFSTCFLLYWGYKLPTRVSVPLILSFSLIILFLPHWMKTIFTPGNFNLTIVNNGSLLALILLVSASWQLFSRPFNTRIEYIEANASQAIYNNEIKNLISESVFTEHTLILAPNAEYPFIFLNPYELDLPDVDILTGGWNSFSPAYFIELKNHGLSDDPSSYIDQPDFFILTRASSIPSIENFFFEHYGIQVKSKIVHAFGQNKSMDLSNNPLVFYNLASSN